MSIQCPSQNGKEPDVLLRYCAGQTTAAEAVALRVHLGDCRACREWVDAQQNLWSELEACDELEISPDFNRRLYQRLEAENSEPAALQWARMFTARWTPFSWKPVIPVAAACVMLIAVLWMREPRAFVQPDENKIRVENVDLDQVERTLEDLDMLKQLGPRVGPGSSSSRSM